MNAKEFAWCYLIKYGYSESEWCTYSYKVRPTAKTTQLALTSILRDGIDWIKTIEPHDISEPCFVGTFAEPEYTTVMSGVIFTITGQKFRWQCEANTRNIFELMAEVQNWKFSTILKNRLRELKNQSK